jgi:hypothetical protein
LILQFDLNFATLQSVLELNDRMVSMENNVGLPSILNIRPATFLNAKVELLQSQVGEDEEVKTGIYLRLYDIEADVHRIDEKVGEERVIEPDTAPTGIFLRLENIEKADTIIPHYEKAYVYYVLLDRKHEVEFESDDFRNISINNTDDKNLNLILENLLTDIEVLKIQNKLTGSMLTQAGFAKGDTRIKAGPASAITFNTRDLSAIGIDATSLQGLSEFTDLSEEGVAQKAVEISNFITEVLFALPFGETIINALGFDFNSFSTEIAKAQDPADFLAGMLLTRVMISATGPGDFGGDLMVNVAPNVGSLTPAEWLNVNTYIKHAKTLHG